MTHTLWQSLGNKSSPSCLPPGAVPTKYVTKIKCAYYANTILRQISQGVHSAKKTETEKENIPIRNGLNKYGISILW